MTDGRMHFLSEKEMNMTKRLSDAIVPTGAGASFAATRHAGLARIEALTDAAEEWLHEHVGTETSWDGGALVVEIRYFAEIADAIIAAGFTFERDPLPN